MASVRFESVSKSYGQHADAVKGLSLEIPDGEFLVLVGPSGCGKTTALRMLAGLESLTSGELFIDEKLVNDVPPKGRDVAMVFQNYALYPHMTVFQNLSFGLKLRGEKKEEIRNRVETVAESLGLSDYLQRKPKALSGGQRQRVALGRAIVRQPRVFLFDEPLSNLDAKLRTETRAELKRLHQRLKTTTVYVTHDQEEAMTLGDRVAVMSKGVLQQCARPLEIYQKPANRFVAEFIGSPQMNFLSGVLDGSTETKFVGEEFSFPVNLRSHQQLSSAKVMLGIRPENLHLQSSRQQENNQPALTFEATIELIETLGANMNVYLRTEAGNSLIARVDGIDSNSGDNVRVNIPIESCHLFERTKTPEHDRNLFV